MTDPAHKQLAVHALEQLPDDATLEDAMERLYLMESIERGQAEIRADAASPMRGEASFRRPVPWSGHARAPDLDDGRDSRRIVVGAVVDRVGRARRRHGDAEVVVVRRVASAESERVRTTDPSDEAILMSRAVRRSAVPPAGAEIVR